jgi:threonine/homoserine/homoserine lactone efflux protein
VVVDLVVLVVVLDIEPAAAPLMAAVESAGAPLSAAVVTVVVESDDTTVVSAFFWQAPSPQAMLAARAMARAVRLIMGSLLLGFAQQRFTSA